MSQFKISIGEMRNKVTFQSGLITDDPVTHKKTTQWNEAFTVWARLVTNSGKVYVKGDSLEPLITHTLTIRYRDDVTRDLRIFYDSKSYKIHKIDPMMHGKQRFLQLALEQPDERIS